MKGRYFLIEKKETAMPNVFNYKFKLPVLQNLHITDFKIYGNFMFNYRGFVAGVVVGKSQEKELSNTARAIIRNTEKHITGDSEESFRHYIMQSNSNLGKNYLLAYAFMPDIHLALPLLR